MVSHSARKRKRANKARPIMAEETPLRFVYLTLPEQPTPTLNITVGNTHTRYAVTRDQLFNLNEQIADALVRHRFSDRTEQLVLNLEKAATY